MNEQAHQIRNTVLVRTVCARGRDVGLGVQHQEQSTLNSRSNHIIEQMFQEDTLDLGVTLACRTCTSTSIEIRRLLPLFFDSYHVSRTILSIGTIHSIVSCPVRTVRNVVHYNRLIQVHGLPRQFTVGSCPAHAVRASRKGRFAFSADVAIGRLVTGLACHDIISGNYLKCQLKRG